MYDNNDPCKLCELAKTEYSCWKDKCLMQRNSTTSGPFTNIQSSEKAIKDDRNN